nr:hypothetical protein [Pedobacter kyonggii]
MEWWQIFKDWFLSLGGKYNVNPFIFGAIYLGAIPFFFAGLYWTVRSIKNKKPIIIPILLTGFFFISAYLYLIIVGKNIPVWVYVFIGIMILYGVYSAIGKVKSKLKSK